MRHQCGGRVEDGMKKEDSFRLEDGFDKLEEIIEKMENDELPLEEAFQAYSEGMGLLKKCSGQIDRVEKQVLKLAEDGQLEAFEDGE